MSDALLARALDLTAAHTIRPGQHTAADARSFVDLFNATYARHITEAYYYWQFFEAPQAGICLLAESDGQVSGVYGLRRLQLSAPIASAVGYAVDLIIRPDVRGTGLWLRLEAEMEHWARANQCGAILAMPNAAALRARVSVLGWQPLGERVVQVAATRARVGHSELVFETTAAPVQVMWQITQAFREQYLGRLWFERKPDYLHWRFVENPVYAYRVVLARRAQTPWAYLVLKTFIDPLTGQGTGDIVDVFWTQDDQDGLAELLGFALDHFQRARIAQAAMWLDTGTALDGAARRLGFRPGEQRRSFIGKALEPGASGLLEPARWFVSLADSEIY